MPQALASCQAQGKSRFPLRTFDRFDPGAKYLRHVGAFKNCQSQQGRQESGELIRRRKQQGKQMLSFVRGGLGQAFEVEHGDELIGKEIIKEKNDDQGRQIAQQFDPCPGKQSAVQACSGADQGKDQPHGHGQ